MHFDEIYDFYLKQFSKVSSFAEMNIKKMIFMFFRKFAAISGKPMIIIVFPWFSL